MVVELVLVVGKLLAEYLNIVFGMVSADLKSLSHAKSYHWSLKVGDSVNICKCYVEISETRK